MHEHIQLLGAPPQPPQSPRWYISEVTVIGMFAGLGNPCERKSRVANIMDIMLTSGLTRLSRPIIIKLTFAADDRHNTTAGYKSSQRGGQQEQEGSLLESCLFATTQLTRTTITRTFPLRELLVCYAAANKNYKNQNVPS